MEKRKYPLQENINCNYWNKEPAYIKMDGQDFMETGLFDQFGNSLVKFKTPFQIGFHHGKDSG